MNIFDKMRFSVIVLVVFTFLANKINCDTGDGISRIDGESISGQTLIKMGRRLNKPMLTFIGMAMTNQHRCSGWTQWTECGVKIVNVFGVRNRGRECFLAKSTSGSSSEVETELGLCEGGTKNTVVCPKTYNMTNNGFCIKLQVTKKNHDDAEAECNEDDGHLININSDLKFADVKSVLRGFSVPNINIGGRRKSSTSQWEYKYGTNNGYYKWYPGYPKSDSSRLCLAFESLKWWNLPCNTAYAFLCEIPK